MELHRQRQGLKWLLSSLSGVRKRESGGRRLGGIDMEQQRRRQGFQRLTVGPRWGSEIQPEPTVWGKTYSWGKAVDQKEKNR